MSKVLTGNYFYAQYSQNGGNGAIDLQKCKQLFLLASIRKNVRVGVRRDASGPGLSLVYVTDDMILVELTLPDQSYIDFWIRKGSDAENMTQTYSIESKEENGSFDDIVRSVEKTFKLV